MKISKYTISVLFTLLFILTGTSFAVDKIQVFVSILPQKYFVERIGGEKVSVDVLVEPGKSPATYSPKISQIRKLASSKLYFRVGVPFENGFMHSLESMKSLKIVDTREGIKLREMTAHHDDEEEHNKGDHNDEHEDEDHHDHTGKDPHIWTNPVLVIKQAETICKELIYTDQQNSSYYKKNLASFIKDLNLLNEKLTKTLMPLKGSNFFVFHPSFGYFADQYGLKQMAVETMGKAPKGKDLFLLIQKARKEKARVIFVQPQFDRHTAAKIADAIKGAVVTIDPLSYDYLKNMEKMAQTVADSLAR